MGLFSKKRRISEAQFRLVIPRLALLLADTRKWVFEECIRIRELSVAQIRNRDLTPKIDIELMGFQFIHIQLALRENRYLDEANITKFLRNLHAAWYPLEAEESQACIDYLADYTDALISLYDQEAEPNKAGTEINWEAAFRLQGVLGFVTDCLGFAIVGEREWQITGFNLAKKSVEMSAMSYTITYLMLLSHLHTAVTFNDKKEIKKIEKEIQQNSERYMKE